ncbi:hypothetical protein [Acutalibacter sp. 1XD8-36]|uniref:hypothetical protein n=1 Tax=Acutalibacter sp. 1XD8-36 TaxID=2320852 RepID=UPI00141308C8|nr:hypothetical protein [Acutalibacter sp. 1XD8-36]NBJ90937.1 hypothetical protein [Acutalibacter sp. 1XD8-36]
MSARKDGTALVIGAIPPNLKLLPSNRNHLIYKAFLTHLQLIKRELIAQQKHKKWVVKLFAGQSDNA